MLFKLTAVRRQNHSKKFRLLPKWIKKNFPNIKLLLTINIFFARAKILAIGQNVLSKSVHKKRLVNHWRVVICLCRQMTKIVRDVLMDLTLIFSFFISVCLSSSRILVVIISSSDIAIISLSAMLSSLKLLYREHAKKKNVFQGHTHFFIACLLSYRGFKIKKKINYEKPHHLRNCLYRTA